MTTSQSNPYGGNATYWDRGATNNNPYGGNATYWDHAMTTPRTTYYRGYIIDMVDMADWRVYWGDAYLGSRPTLECAKMCIDERELEKARIIAIR